DKTGVVTMIVDANAISVEILGKGKGLAGIDDETLVAMIRDNPAGQVRQLTPFILIREVETQND
ncbi:MAG: F420-0--gamma-glutamyl ligase, partial [Oscillospiraceae bacterium]